MTSLSRKKQIQYYKFLTDELKGYRNMELRDVRSTQIDNFIRCVENCSMKKGCSQLYISRKGSIIEYGRYKDSTKLEKLCIELNESDSIRTICNKLQTRFGSKFAMRSFTIDDYGTILTIIINNNTLIKVNSDNKEDQKWFKEGVLSGYPSKISRKK